MDACAKQVTGKARAVAAQLGLGYLDVDEQEEITGARWRAWADLPETRRVIAWLAEGFVAASEAAETNGIKRRHMGDATHELATQEIMARQDAEVHRRLLVGVAKMANRQD